MRFAAVVLARTSAITPRHARRLLAEDVSHLGARQWALVAMALDQGVGDVSEFVEILDIIQAQ